jgi:Histidine kinase-, DNA gyrase B-, and HSP90-like ATPase
MYEAKIEDIRSRAVRESTAQKAKLASAANPSQEGADSLLGVDQTVILEISVRDTGIGIPSDRLPKLFKSFSQIDISTARRYGGTGLGLAISSTLVNHMGGGLWVESEEGVGSRFALTIPIAVAAHQPDTPGNRSSDGWTPLTSPPSPCSTSSEGTSGTQSLNTDGSQEFTSPASGCLSPSHNATHAQGYFSQPVVHTARPASPVVPLVQTRQSGTGQRQPAIPPLTWPVPQPPPPSSFHLGIQSNTKHPPVTINMESKSTSKPLPSGSRDQPTSTKSDPTTAVSQLGVPSTGLAYSPGLKPQTSDARCSTTGSGYVPSISSSSPRKTAGEQFHITSKPFDESHNSDSLSSNVPRRSNSLLTSTATSGGHAASHSRSSRASVAKQHHHQRRGGNVNEENLAISFPIKILLAEDNVLNQKIAISILKRLGYTGVEIANNGREVLDAMRRSRFDLIFVSSSCRANDLLYLGSL